MGQWDVEFWWDTQERRINCGLAIGAWEGVEQQHPTRIMKYLLTILFTLSCCCQSFSLTADQLAEFLRISSWESEVQLPANSFTVEVLEFSDGKVGKALTPTYDDPDTASQNPPLTGGTPVLIMWKPGEHGLFLTVTMGTPANGSETRPGFHEACQNFIGIFVSGRILKSIKEGDYILGGEPLEHDGAYKGTDDIKDYKRGLLLRITKKA